MDKNIIQTHLPKCGWPSANLGLRIFNEVGTMVLITALFFKTIVSEFAITIHLFGALFWYSAFILDSNSYTLGMSACQEAFSSTAMGDRLSLQQVVVMMIVMMMMMMMMMMMLLLLLL